MGMNKKLLYNKYFKNNMIFNHNLIFLIINFLIIGDGSNKSQNKPILNNYFEMLRNDDKITIQKMKSSNNYSVAKMSDGNLLGWGSNESG